jgi:hypothetical protein
MEPSPQRTQRAQRKTSIAKAVFTIVFLGDFSGNL